MRALMIVFLALLPMRALGQQYCAAQEAVTQFGSWLAPNVKLTPTMYTTLVVADNLGFQSASMRLSLQINIDAKDRNWNIVVRDPTLRVLATLGPKDFEDESGKLARTRWTGRLSSGSLRVDLLAAPSSDAQLTISDAIAYPAESSDTHLFSVKGSKPTWEPLYESSDLRPKRAGDVIGMLVAGAEDPDGGPRLAWCCSGVMVSSDLLLTNWHCGGHPRFKQASLYWNRGVCESMLIDLAWDWNPRSAANASLRRTPSRQYNCHDVLAFDRRLDYALIRVKPVVGGGGPAGEAVAARIETQAPAKDDRVFLIHHAKCSTKLLSKQCSIRNPTYKAWWEAPERVGAAAASNPDLTNDCDSEPGASGAGLFDWDGRLIGLHHAGFSRDAQCNAIDHVNKAVRIEEILEHIKMVNPLARQEIKPKW